VQGHRQKIFQGGGGNEKKAKNYQKIPKNSTICVFQGGGGQRKKDRKIAKKGRK